MDRRRTAAAEVIAAWSAPCQPRSTIQSRCRRTGSWPRLRMPPPTSPKDLIGGGTTSSIGFPVQEELNTSATSLHPDIAAISRFSPGAFRRAARDRRDTRSSRGRRGWLHHVYFNVFTNPEPHIQSRRGLRNDNGTRTRSGAIKFYGGFLQNVDMLMDLIASLQTFLRVAETGSLE